MFDLEETRESRESAEGEADGGERTRDEVSILHFGEKSQKQKLEVTRKEKPRLKEKMLRNLRKEKQV